MPIGNLSNNNSAPRRESFRPPWVKEKDVDAPPAWMQKKLKSVDTKTDAKPLETEPAAAATTKPLKRKCKYYRNLQNFSNIMCILIFVINLEFGKAIYYYNLNSSQFNAPRLFA